MDLLFLKLYKRKHVHFKPNKWTWPSVTDARAAQYERFGDCHPFIRIKPAPTVKERHRHNKPYRKQRYNPYHSKGYL